MFNDFKAGDKVWHNNKSAIVLEAKPSIMGKEYIIAYEDGSSGGNPSTVQPWSVISLADAVEKGYTKPKEEKPKKDLGNFKEGLYNADEVAILIGGKFSVMKFNGIKDTEEFKALDPMMQFSMGILANTAFKFEDGTFAQKALAGGYGLWRDYEVSGNQLTLNDQKETITLALLADGRIQRKTADGTGQEIHITYKLEE
ncbi:MAG: hypothetical protein FWD49_06885 [Firmicutes bacterium]|nr:hypothetical protein [Bacillota bacterium]